MVKVVDEKPRYDSNRDGFGSTSGMSSGSSNTIRSGGSASYPVMFSIRANCRAGPTGGVPPTTATPRSVVVVVPGPPVGCDDVPTSVVVASLTEGVVPVDDCGGLLVPP